jgi:hypothetical protein
MPSACRSIGLLLESVSCTTERHPYQSARCMGLQESMLVIGVVSSDRMVELQVVTYSMSRVVGAARAYPRYT